MSMPTLVILAAGIGSRYGGLKQLEPVGPHGESIIDYSVYDALQAGFGRVVLVINREIERPFRQRIGHRIERQCETTYVFQSLDDLPPGFQAPAGRSKPWGTAHAVLSCRGSVDSPFAVINADDLYGRASFRALHAFLASRWKEREPRTPSWAEGAEPPETLSGPPRRAPRDHPRQGIPEYGMVAFAVEKTLSEHGPVSRAVCRVGPDGYLLELHERTHIVGSRAGARYLQEGKTWIALSPGTLVSMNMWGFTPELFPELGARFGRFLEASRDHLERVEWVLPDVIGEMIQEGRARVRILSTSERWHGVTYAQDSAAVKRAVGELIALGIYPERLWELPDSP